MGVSISYAITVCNELDEIKHLVPFLHKYKRPEDEIVILLDKPKASQELLDQLYKYSSADWIKLKESVFQGHFADWKNELTRMCSGDMIINLDADEIPNQHLIESLPFILEHNESDIILVPRINTVDNIGLSHIQKWGWKISRLENMKEEKIFDLSNPKDLDEYNLLKQNSLIIEERVISSK
jgi:hypothetical protein